VALARCCAEALEALISAPHLTGETFSLADIRLMPHFDWLRLTPEGDSILADKRKLVGWFQRVNERPTAYSSGQKGPAAVDFTKRGVDSGGPSTLRARSSTCWSTPTETSKRR
jgi:glutathione S-transferase